MTTIFGSSLKPPQGRMVMGATQPRGEPVAIGIDALAFLKDMWSWVAGGYLVIPCDVGGSANAITLTPRFRPEIGGADYADLLAFSFTAASTCTAATTISVIGENSIALDAVAAYLANIAVASGDIVAGVPYIAIYCVADSGLSLPARMVLK